MNTSVRKVIGKAIAKAPGTCGELAQGIVDGEHFLITCPIDMYSTATVEIVEGSGVVNGPDDCPKSRRAVELTLGYLKAANVGASLSLASPLPRGKGMASSTADVSAAIQAAALALGSEMSSEEVAQIALSIEPSDGIMFSGIALFDHRQGKTVRLLGEAPPMGVLVLDFGGSVDTVQYNGADRTQTLRKHESKWQESIDLICEGVRTGDVRMIGRGTTISALLHQEILYKPQLDAVLKLSKKLGAAGVNIAHSGTVIGMLFEDDDSMIENAAAQAQQNLSGLHRTIPARLVDGGIMPTSIANQEA